MTEIGPLEAAVNDAVMSVHQVRNPLEQARQAGELIDYLQCVADSDLAQTRRLALAEAVQWPAMSMAKVANELGMSKSAVARLAAPHLRKAVAVDLRARLVEGHKPPGPVQRTLSELADDPREGLLPAPGELSA